MTQGGIARWEKKEGESFTAGELLLQIETDKAQMDVEAQDDGVLVKILAAEGSQNVSVNSPIAIIAEEGDDLASIDIAGLSVAKESATTEAKEPAMVEEKTEHKGKGGLLAPAAGFAIHANHIANANEIVGTGPKGRVLKGDVLRFLKEGKAVIDKKAGVPVPTTSNSSPSPPPAAAAAVSTKKPAATSVAAASSGTEFLVQSLESSVLRHLNELEIAKRSTTVQVPAGKLAKLVKSDKSLTIEAFALRAAALALHQVSLAKEGVNNSVGVAVEGSKTPAVHKVADATTSSVLELASSIKSAAKSASADGSNTPAVVLAAEGLYTPGTLPANTTVLVVGKPHTIVSAAEANAALDSTLDELISGGGGSKKAASSSSSSSSSSSLVVNVSVISESPAAAAFAAKIKGVLSNPEILTF